jgi:hypothetical protein
VSVGARAADTAPTTNDLYINEQSINAETPTLRFSSPRFRLIDRVRLALTEAALGGSMSWTEVSSAMAVFEFYGDGIVWARHRMEDAAG